MRSPPHEERSPDLLEQGEASGIEALPGRVSRYGEAKRRALEVAQYIGQQEGGKTLSGKVEGCGDYLLFRHYFTVDQVRLHAAYLCKKHLLCPLCAVRRGAKAMQAYLPRYEAVRASRPDLRPFLVTLTVKDGPDLAERFKHLHDSQRELWKRKQRGRGSVLDQVEAAVWSYEVKKGARSGLWHPHLHMVALAPGLAGEDYSEGTLGELSREWRAITADSFMVNVKAIDQADPASGFLEVFKYALKFSDMEHADTWEAFQVLRGRRLVGSAGLFRGIEIPDQLLDEPFDDLPYAELFFRYLRGVGYSVAKGGQGLAVRRAEAAEALPC
jgi:hypothetical protein